MGADSRTSNGSYVANKAADKLTQLADRVYICRSGSAADTQAISSYVQHFLNQHGMESGEPVTVKNAAMAVRSIAYQNKERLMAGMIVAGWDREAGGSIWAVPLGGTLLPVPVTCGGSGSIYISGFVDKFWKPNMTREECRDFVVRAVSLAISRDGSSGGCIRTCVIDKDGVQKSFVPGSDVPQHQDEIAPQAQTAAAAGMQIG